MSAASATEQLSKSDEYVIAELRDPDKRSARLVGAKRDLKLLFLLALAEYAVAMVLIIFAWFGQLFHDASLFSYAVPGAIFFLSLSVMMFFLCLRTYADVKAIHVYMALAQDKSTGNQK